MTDNEKQFIRTFVDFESNMKSARQYIKETYGVDSEFNEEENYIKLYCPWKIDVINLVSAKDFINETFDTGFVDVIFYQKYDVICIYFTSKESVYGKT